MELQIDLAIRYAAARDKKVGIMELAKAMYPESKKPYQNLWHLRKGITRKVSIDQNEAIIRMTGIPIEMLIR